MIQAGPIRARSGNFVGITGGKGWDVRQGAAEGYFATWEVVVGHLRMKSKLREAESKSGEGQNPDKNT